MTETLSLTLMNAPFNINIKREYSWLQRGITSSIINTSAQGSCTIISGILSNGEFLCMILDGTRDSDKFWEFLSILNYAIEFTKINIRKEYYLMMDNATIYYSFATKSIINRLKLNIMYLPAYSSELVPIEKFFRLVQNKIRASIIDKNTHLQTRWENHNKWLY